MKKLVIFIFVAGTVAFSSCSKMMNQNASQKSKTIMIVGKVHVETIDGVEYASFRSENGTKYTVDLSKYSYKLADNASVDAPKSNLSYK